MAVKINGSTGIELEDNDKQIFGTGDDLQIYYSGSDGFIKQPVGTMWTETPAWCVTSATGSEYMARFDENGSCKLYYDNSKKFETTTDGVQVNGDFKILNGGDDIFFDASGNWMRWDDGVKIQCGNSGDLEIYHDGSNSYIKNSGTGNLFVDIAESSKFDVHHDGETIFAGYADGRFEAMYDGAVKIVTTGSGITVYGSVSTADLNLSNLDHTTPNEVDNTKGSWSMQEGANDLFLINRTNGKKYKFNLTEVVS